jgi:hypothetical protein
MKRDPGQDLLNACQEAKARGADFPTVWSSVLRPNRLVRGQPRQAITDGRPTLIVDLVTGQSIVHADGSYRLS